MNPLLIEIPLPILSPRLRIAALELEDGQAYFQAVNDSFDELHKWMPWARTRPSLEESNLFVRRQISQFILRKELTLAIWDRNSNEFIGSSGLHRIDWQVPKFEIGYWIATKHSGKGYITESVNAITRYAMSQLKAKRIEIRCDETNVRSAAVAQRLGFRMEGILKHHDLAADGQSLRNTMVFARLDTEGLPPL